MSRKELGWFLLFLTGLALVAVPRGWKSVLSNIGLGIMGWVIGRALR